MAIEARYIVTGFKKLTTNEAHSEVAETLDDLDCADLSKRGFAMRAEKFELVSNNSKVRGWSGRTRVLVHLFTTSDLDMRDVRATSRHLGLDVGMLKYYLDCLAGAGFADFTGGNYVTVAVYWAITPNCRKYAVQQKLV